MLSTGVHFASQSTGVADEGVYLIGSLSPSNYIRRHRSATSGRYICQK